MKRKTGAAKRKRTTMKQIRVARTCLRLIGECDRLLVKDWELRGKEGDCPQSFTSLPEFKKRKADLARMESKYKTRGKE